MLPSTGRRERPGIASGRQAPPSHRRRAMVRHSCPRPASLSSWRRCGKASKSPAPPATSTSRFGVPYTPRMSGHSTHCQSGLPASSGAMSPSRTAGATKTSQRPCARRSARWPTRSVLQSRGMTPGWRFSFRSRQSAQCWTGCRHRSWCWSQAAGFASPTRRSRIS